MSAVCTIPQSQGGELPSRCGRVDCTEPGTVATVLVKHGRRTWSLAHCEGHRSDGADLAVAAGFPVLTNLDDLRGVEVPSAYSLVEVPA